MDFYSDLCQFLTVKADWRLLKNKLLHNTPVRSLLVEFAAKMRAKGKLVSNVNTIFISVEGYQ